MKKPGEISYVKKIYKILVTSMSYLSSFRYEFHSQYTAHQEAFEVQSKSIINKVYEFSAVDTLLEGKHHTIDKMINLQIFIDELAIASVSLDLGKEKVVKEDSKSLFRRKFNNDKGYIDYKLISVNTRIITKDQFKNEEDNRNRLSLRKKLDYRTLKKDNDRLEFQIQQKDKMIESLSNKINDLLNQNIELTKQINEELEQIKNPLNIKVNILATAKKEEFNTMFGANKINIWQMEKDLELTHEECNKLKERIAELEVQNKMLEEKCLVLITEFTDQFRRSKGKEVQKKIENIDTLYLLKKNINSYDKPESSVHPQIQMIQQAQEEEAKIIQEYKSRYLDDNVVQRPSSIQNKLGRRQSRQFQIFFSPPVKQQSKKQIVQDIKLQSSMREVKEMVMKDVKETANEQKLKGLKGSGIFRMLSLNHQKLNASTYGKNKSSANIKSLNEAAGKDMNISKEEQKMLLIRIQTKEKQIQFLANELSKKQTIIDKMLVKEKMFEKMNNELAQQKARMLTTSALNLVGPQSGTEVLTRIRELSVYNNEILKEKYQISEQLYQLKQDLNQHQKKLNEYQAVSRKSLLMLSQIGRQKEVIETKLREVIQSQRFVESKLLEQKNAKYQCLKAEYITCQGELRQSKQKLANCELELDSTKNKLTAVENKLKEIKQRSVKLEADMQFYEGQKRQNAILTRKYDQIERFMKGIKTFVLRLESEYYKKIKNSHEEVIKGDIRKMFKTIYDQINQFQKEYYGVLLTSIDVIKQATEKYYEDTHKFYVEIAADVESKQEIEERKAEILREGNKKMEILNQKENQIKQRMNKRLAFTEQSEIILSQGIRLLQNKLKEMQSYKIHLKELNKNQKFAVPILYIPEESMQSSQMSMFKSGQSNPAKQTIPMMKSSTHLKSSIKSDLKSKQTNKIMKIDQEEEEDAQKAPFINLSMLKNTNFSVKRQLSDKQQRQSGSQEKNSENNNLKESLFIQKTNHSKMILDNEKYREVLLKSISKQNQFSKQRMMLREKQMQIYKQLGTKIRKLEMDVFHERAQKQRAVMKHRERQKDLEKQFKTVQYNTQVTVKKSTKEMELVSVQLEVLKTEVEEKTSLIERLSMEIQETNTELLETISQRNDLRMRCEEMNHIIEDYETAQYIFKQQVREIKANYVKTDDQMTKIIQERSLQFMHIEKIKSVEIQKLKSVILELQTNLSEEINDNLQQKNTIEQLKQDLRRLQTQNVQLREQSKLQINRLEAELNQEKQLNIALEKEMEVYQKNIMEFSYNIEGHQKEEIRLNLIIEKYETEKNVYKTLEQNLQERQQNLKQDYRKYEFIINEKNLKIKGWEQNYLKLELAIQQIKSQAQSIKEQNTQLKQEMGCIKQQQFNMERLVIQVQKEKSFEQIKNQKLSMQIQEHEKEKKNLQAAIQQLTQKIQKLQTPKKSLLQPPGSPRSARSSISQSSQGQVQGKPAGKQYSSMAVKSVRQICHYTSLGYSKSSPEEQKQKKKKQQQERFKQDCSDFLTNKSQSIMKISKNLDPSMDTNTETETKMNKRRPTQLIQVKEMKKNRYLNLPPIDFQAQTSVQNIDLGTIEEHHDQMEDTFLKIHSSKTSKNRNLAEDLQQSEIQYQIQLHEPKDLDQSAVDIEMMESLHSQNINQIYQGQSLDEEFQQLIDKDDVYNEFKDYQQEQLIEQIISLRNNIEKLKKKLEQQNNQQQMLDSPILKMPEIKITQKNDKSVFERTLKDYFVDGNPSSMIQRKQSYKNTKSINFGDLQIKTLEEELQTLRKKASEEQKKNAEKELAIAEKTQQIEALTKTNSEKQTNIENLMQELKKVSESNEVLLAQNQRLKIIGRQLKARLQNSFLDFSAKCQQLIAQSMKKDESLLQLNLQFQKEAQMRSRLEQKLDQLQKAKRTLQQKVAVLQKQIQRNKKEYLKYEQQAEIQILNLKEHTDQLKALIEQKQSDLIVMGQKYVQLEEEKQKLILFIQQSSSTRKQYQKNIEKAKEECNNVKNQYETLQGKRNKVLAQTKNLERENMRLKQELQTVQKNTAMEIQKSLIKYNQQNELIASLKQKLSQKQQVISQLKNEIALYNNQTEQLRISNQQLSEELAKTEKQLREIMVSYEQEFKKLSRKQIAREEKIQQNISVVQQKGYELSFKDKQIRNLCIELKSTREQNADLMSKIQKMRVTNAVKLRQFQNQIALKDDKIARLGNEISILSTKLQENKVQLQSKVAKKQITSLQEHNQQLQSKLEELHKQLTNTQKLLQQRPKVEEYNELKYKVQVLQSSLKHNSQSAKNQIQKIAEQDRHINSTYKKQLEKASKQLLREKQKGSSTLNELRQVVEAYKKLENKNASINSQLESEKRASSILRLQYRHLQKLVKQLQRENQQLQRSQASLLSKRSFSRQLTDTTLI